MTIHFDALGQPIGAPVPGWKPRPRPDRITLSGRYCRLELLDPDRHAADLFDAFSEDKEGKSWAYLPYGPFAALEEFTRWSEEISAKDDPLFFAIVTSETGKAGGVTSLMRVDPPSGSIEVGGVHYSPRLQRTTATTEAMFLIMKYAFEDLGYRRYEWKTDALNEPLRSAAERFGFVFEGLFRQATIYKGRNRDTAWYSIIDSEWPAIKSAFITWLSPENFDETGRQLRSLAMIRSA